MVFINAEELTPYITQTGTLILKYKDATLTIEGVWRNFWLFNKINGCPI